MSLASPALARGFFTTSSTWKVKVKVKSLSRVRLFALQWTVAHHAPLFMGFSRQEYRNGLPCPIPEDLLNPGIEPMSLASPVLASGFFTTSATGEAAFILVG